MTTTNEHVTTIALFLDTTEALVLGNPTTAAMQAHTKATRILDKSPLSPDAIELEKVISKAAWIVTQL